MKYLILGLVLTVAGLLTLLVGGFDRYNKQSILVGELNEQIVELKAKNARLDSQIDKTSKSTDIDNSASSEACDSVVVELENRLARFNWYKTQYEELKSKVCEGSATIQEVEVVKYLRTKPPKEVQTRILEGTKYEILSDVIIGD